MSPTHGLPNRLPPPSTPPTSQAHETSPTKTVPPPHSASDNTILNAVSGQLNTSVSSPIAKHTVASAMHHFQPIPAKFAFHHLPATKLIPASAFPVSVIKTAADAIKQEASEPNGLSQSSGEESPLECPKITSNDTKQIFSPVVQKLPSGPSLVVSSGTVTDQKSIFS